MQLTLPCGVAQLHISFCVTVEAKLLTSQTDEINCVLMLKCTCYLQMHSNISEPLQDIPQAPAAEIYIPS